MLFQLPSSCGIPHEKIIVLFPLLTVNLEVGKLDGQMLASRLKPRRTP